jgi:hypothetical protein
MKYNMLMVEKWNKAVHDAIARALAAGDKNWADFLRGQLI